MPSSSTHQEHPEVPDRPPTATAAGQLTLIHYKPFQHAEIRMLEALSQALPWSKAVATALAMARSGAKHNVAPTAGDGIATRGNVCIQPLKNKVRADNQRRSVPLGGESNRSVEDDPSVSSSDSNRSDDCSRNRRGAGASGPCDRERPSLDAHAIQLALATLGGVPGHLAGAAESRCSAAAFALSVAMASVAEGHLPPQLLRVVSPYRASLEQLRPLGKGGFGSVVAVRSRLDHRVMALKSVAFRSNLPPWAPLEQLERQHIKLLREVQALATLDGSPHVVRYFNAWIEPAWEKLGHQLQRSRTAHESVKPPMESIFKALVKATAQKPTAGNHRAAAAIVAAMPGANAATDVFGLRAAAAVSAECLKKRSQIAMHRLPVTNDASGATGLHACRIRELRGSCSNRSNGDSGHSNDSSRTGGESYDDNESRSDDDVEDGCNSGKWNRAPLLGVHRTCGSKQLRCAPVNTLRRQSPSEPVVDLPISPSETSVAMSSVDTDAAVSYVQSVMSLPPSSCEGTRRRSLDIAFSALGQRCRSTAPFGDGGISGAENAQSSPSPTLPMFSFVNTPQHASGLPRVWAMPMPRTVARWTRSQSGPLITSLSTSPEGQSGPTTTHVSLLSSSVESIRVPPGARVAVSATDALGGGGSADTSSVSSGATNRNRTDGGRGHCGGQRRTEEYGWTFDHGGKSRCRINQGLGSSETSTVTHTSSLSSAATASATNTDVCGGGVEVEFSWTFDRGDGGVADASVPRTRGRDDVGCARPSGISAADGSRIQGLSDGHGSSRSYGETGGGDGRTGSGRGLLERRYRKGRRGKRTQKGAVVLSGSDSLFQLDGVMSGSERPAHAEQLSSDNTDGDDNHSEGDSSTGSSSFSESEDGSLSGSWSYSVRRNNEGSSSSSGDGSNAEHQLLDTHTRCLTHLERSRSGAIVPPTQVPLLAPRHQRSRLPSQTLVHSTGKALVTGVQGRRERQQQRNCRRKQRVACHSSETETGELHRAARKAALSGKRRERQGRLPPAGAAAAPCDLSILSGISNWPYRLYISMELVIGPTLTRWLQLRAERLRDVGSGSGGRTPEHPPQPAGIERSIFRQIVTGLSYIHAAGILHRDLKPANIFLVPVMEAPDVDGIGFGSKASLDGFAAGPGAAEPDAAHHASLRGAMLDPVGVSAGHELYLAKIGDFGLAVEHVVNEDPSATLRTASSSSSSTSASSSSSPVTASPHRPVGSAAVVAAAAISNQGAFRRPRPVPLLPEIAAGLQSAEAAVVARQGRSSASASLPCMELPRWNSSSTSGHTSGIGTASYSAPEQLQDQPGGTTYYGSGVDIYPLGLILMELFCVHGTAMERANAMREARQGRLPPSFHHTYPGEARLAEACLHNRPELRPRASRILALLDLMWGPQTGAKTAHGSTSNMGIRGGAQQAAAGSVAVVRTRTAGSGEVERTGVFGAHTLSQRTTSGPLPWHHLQRVQPLPILPPPLPGLAPSVRGSHMVTLPEHDISPDNAKRTALTTGSGCFHAASISAAVESMGTQTDLTWVSEDQAMPLPIAVAGKLVGGLLTPPLPVVVACTAVPTESARAVSELDAPSTIVSGSTGNGAGPAWNEPMAQVEERTAMQARLQSLEAEVQRLQQQLAQVRTGN